MFVVSLTYTNGIEKVNQHLEEHRRYLDEHYAKGHFIASGRKEPRTGGVILAQGMTRAELEEMITFDPFYRTQAASYEITEFVPSKTSEQLNFLQEA